MRNHFLCAISLLLTFFLAHQQRLKAQIIADHTVVDKYSQIPDYWISEVKKMWVDIPGESHSKGIRIGCYLLENLDERFQVSIRESGVPEGYTDQHMRLSRATWGDYNNAGSWIYNYGEEDWFTNSVAIERTKAHLTYCNTNNLQIAAMGFGWCWDMTSDNWPGGTPDPEHQVRWAGRTYNGPEGNRRWGLNNADTELTGNSVSMDTYLNATVEYINHCLQNGYPTRVFFTTGPVDGNSNRGENGYQRSIKHNYIKNFVSNSADYVLFDYADILCYSDAGDEQTLNWTDFGGVSRTFQFIHDDNMLDLDGSYTEDGDHIGQRGALRLAKALWWMLARMAGWDGQPLSSDFADAEQPQFYPNPSNGEIYLKNFSIFGPCKISIFDANGRKLNETDFSSGNSWLDVSNLSAGVYILQLKSKGSSFYQRIVKQ